MKSKLVGVSLLLFILWLNTPAGAFDKQIATPVSHGANSQMSVKATNPAIWAEAGMGNSTTLVYYALFGIGVMVLLGRAIISLTNVKPAGDEYLPGA